MNIHMIITEFLFQPFHDIESVSLSRAFENKATMESIEFCAFLFYYFFFGMISSESFRFNVPARVFIHESDGRSNSELIDMASSFELRYFHFFETKK